MLAIPLWPSHGEKVSLTELLLLLLLLLKGVGSARLGESYLHPISLKTPAPQYQPIDRYKRKGKIVENYIYIVGIEQLRPIQKHRPYS